MTEPNSDLLVPIWISKSDQLPDLCCRCGMYTDNRVNVKHPIFVTKEAGGTSVLLIILGLLLGPVGWLLAAANSGSKDKTKTVKKTVKFKISQCLLCHGQSKPEIMRYNSATRQFEVLVHHEFAARKESLVSKESLEKQDQNISRQ